MRSVLVTGAKGFVGVAVTAELERTGYGVTALSHQDLDLTNHEQVMDIIGPNPHDCVIHLAGRISLRATPDQTDDYSKVNLKGTASLLEAVGQWPGESRVVYASTVSVYGSQYDVPLHEGLDPNPAGNPYAESKLAAENHLLRVAAAKRSKISGIIFRMSNVAGACDGVPDLSAIRALPNLFRAVKLPGTVPTPFEMNNRYAERDFVHPEDVRRALIMGLKMPVNPATRCERFILASGVSWRLLDLLEMVEYVSGYPVIVDYRKEKPRRDSISVNPSRLITRTGWAPHNSDLETIVRDGWDAWQSQLVI